MLIFLALFSLVPLVHGQDCDMVPPALLCDNKDLALKCGISEICNRYEKATQGKKLQISVMYWTHCGASINLINTQLKAVHGNWSKYVDVELLPCEPNEDYMECVDEPFANVELCAIKSLPDPYYFISCLEAAILKHQDIEGATQNCFAEEKIPTADQDKIRKCAQDTKLTTELRQQMTKRWQETWPEKSDGVPHLLFNGVSTLAIQRTAREALEPLLCTWLEHKYPKELTDICGVF